MKIATRINSLFFLVVLCLGCVAALLLAAREYQWALASVQTEATATLRGHPELQFYVYKEDQSRLQEILGEFLTDNSIISAIAYSNLNAQLARRDQPSAPNVTIRPLSSVREDMLAVDSRLASFDAAGAELTTGILDSLFNLDSPLYFSQPIFTAINPANRGLEAQDFSIAINGARQTTSQWVIGYVNVVIDRRALFIDAGPALLKVLLLSTVLAGLTGLLIGLITRRIFQPLTELSALAEDVAAGRLEKSADINGSAEIRRIAKVFNSVVGGLQEYKKKQDAGRQLLNMKVEERSSQLNARNAALSKARKQVNATRHRLHHLANYDNLTKLPNRQLFTEQLELLLRVNQRNKKNLALLFIDLDDFKRVNESLGITAGDMILMAVAERLSDQVRDSDALAHLPEKETDIGVSRLGGDEFTVVLNEVESANAATQVAERILASLCQPLQVAGHEVAIKPSIGIAMAPEHGADVESLLRAASTAKLHAKAAGGPKIQLFHLDLGSEDVQRIKLESELRKAVANAEFVLHYQPQIEAHSGSVVGAEALLRWQHPELGLLPPGSFIALAESIGVIDQLGDWVLAEACRQVKEFNNEGLQLPRVSINISPLQFSSAFMQRVATVLDETGLPPTQLELGLPEAIMTSPDSESLNAIQALKTSGVYLSVDDFGTGYSPLQYLTQFPLDELKIDRHFIVESQNSPNGAKLVRAIIAMAHSLGLRVLAQGVETEEQFRLLIDGGANNVQGYLFSKPVTATELRAMLKPWHFMEKIQKIIASGTSQGA